jgi:mRNA interferase HigB
MRVISRGPIREASGKHSGWRTSLDSWYRIARKAEWNNFTDVKASWNNVKQVGDYIVFKIAHNECRLITLIFYQAKRVYVRGVLSHVEYDRGGWKE